MKYNCYNHIGITQTHTYTTCFNHTHSIFKQREKHLLIKAVFFFFFNYLMKGIMWILLHILLHIYSLTFIYNTHINFTYPLIN